MRGYLVGAAIIFSTVLLGVGQSRGDVVGTFRWRLEPFCNVVHLTVIQEGAPADGGAGLLTGFDDDCGFSGGVPVSGTIFRNPSGFFVGSFTIIGPGGVAINNLIQLNPATGSGTWSDNFGNSGAFTINPSTAPGSPHSSAIETVTVFAFGQIREDASIRSSSSKLVSVDHPTTGIYCLNFSQGSGNLEGAVVGLAGAGTSSLFARVSNGQGGDCPTRGQLNVRIVNESGVLTDGRFSFIVPR
jgi:hypothetical protein